MTFSIEGLHDFKGIIINKKSTIIEIGLGNPKMGKFERMFKNFVFNQKYFIKTVVFKLIQN